MPDFAINCPSNDGNVDTTFRVKGVYPTKYANRSPTTVRCTLDDWENFTQTVEENDVSGENCWHVDFNGVGASTDATVLAELLDDQATTLDSDLIAVQIGQGGTYESCDPCS